MFMCLISRAAVTCIHTPAKVFKLWANPGSWPSWDPEVLRVDFAGPMRLGAKGVLWPTKGPRARFTVTVLDEDARLEDTTSLPGARLVFDHRVEAAPQGSQITVSVELRGLAAPVWRRLLASGLRESAVASAQGLVTHLDAGAQW